MKKILSVIFFIGTIFSVIYFFDITAGAETKKYDYITLNGEEIYYYYSYNRTVVYSCNTSISGNITIPSKLSGYPVTVIDSNAFKGCESLTSITIPETVTSIGESAFENCTNLESITISDNVNYIGKNAFYNTKYYNNSKNWEKDVLYIDDCLLKVKNTVSGKFEVDSSVRLIAGYAFYDCKFLKEVEVSNNVEFISAGAFENCTSLEEITVPFIGSSRDAKNSASAVFGYIFGYSLSYQSGTTYQCKIYDIDKGKYKPYYYYIPSSLKSVTITDTNQIPCRSFYNCSDITSVTVGECVTSIGDYAFYNCTSLTNITIPNSVTSMGERVFRCCDSMKNITLPFIGSSRTAKEGYNAVFGYIFGYTISNDAAEPSGTTFQYKIYDNYEKKYDYYNYYIPSSLESVTITDINQIPYRAFYNCSDITSITLSDSVNSVSELAFSGCNIKNLIIADGSKNITDTMVVCPWTLESITIPNSVTSIGDYAFEDCTSLKSITIPNSVTSIGKSVLINCTKLESIKVDSNNKNYSSASGVLFDKNKTDLISYPAGKMTTSYKIPVSVKNIKDNAFYNCSNLKEIKIANSVKNIGAYAFNNCKSLKNVTIPDSVTNMGECVFRYCDSIENITLPFMGSSRTAKEGYKAVFGYIFGYITSEYKYSRTTTIEGTILQYHDNNFNYHYYIPISLKSVVITDVNQIPDNAFYNCDSLTSITLPNKVTNIGSYAFYNSGFSNIIIPNSVQNIGNSAFSNSAYLTSLTIPNSVTSIGASAFQNCKSLKNLSIGKGVKSLDSSALYGCSNLESITLPFVGQNADGTGFSNFGYIFGANDSSYPYFENVDFVPKSLKNVVITGSNSIANNAFYGCAGLVNVSFLGNVKNIGEWVFGDCSGLKSVRLPASCKNIGAMTFYDCINLTNVYFMGTKSQKNIEIKHGNDYLNDESIWRYGCCYYNLNHKYTNKCDKTCNVCSAKRTIKHTYSNACDTSCNVCKATRKITHSYKTTTTKATLSKNGKTVKKCTVCGKVASKTAIKYAKTFKLSTTTYNYNGKVKMPTVTVKDSAGKVLKKNTDYTVTYASGRKNVGTYKVTVKMIGKYSGTKTLTFKINPVKISLYKLSATSYTYDGKVKTPSVTVKNANGTKLTKNTHYTITYAVGRKNVGAYKVTIKGKGNYTGTKTLTFKINPPKTTVSKLTAGKKSITVAITKKSTQVTGYQIQYSTSKTFSKATTKTISRYKTTKYTLKSLSAKKTYYVRVRTYKTVNGTKYYSGWSTYKYVKTK